MSRRKTVALNLEKTNKLIKKVCRSNTVFCEKMERGASNWVSDWNRKDKSGNPTPKNLPSPEEAAQMCVLLNTAPEEILSKPEDIELVKGLLDQEREKSIKKDLPEEVQMSGAKREAWELIKSWDDDRIQKFIAAAKAMLGE